MKSDGLVITKQGKKIVISAEELERKFRELHKEIQKNREQMERQAGLTQEFLNIVVT